MSNGGPSHATIANATVQHATIQKVEVQLNDRDLKTIGDAAGEGVGNKIRDILSKLDGTFASLKVELIKQTTSIDQGFEGVQVGIRDVGDAVEGVQGELGTMQVQLLTQLALEMKAIQAVEQEVNRSIKAGVQAQLSKLLGDLEGLKTAVRIALTQIAEIFCKSVKRQRAIFEKYSRMEGEVLRAFERDIRKLGEPIYRFIENEYFPLLDLSKGFVEDTKKSMLKSTQGHLERRERLDDLPQEDLQQAKAQFMRNTEARTHSRSQNGGKLQLDDGLIRLESVVCASGNPAHPAKLLTSFHFDEATGGRIGLSEVEVSGKNDLTWRPCTPDEKIKMMDAFARLQGRGLISESHAEFLKYSVEAHGFETCDGKDP